MQINEENLKTFWQYIAERHRIYKKSKILKLEKPWTEDKILQEYKFTNVFRELDTGTKYAIERIIPRCRNTEEIIFNLIIYRLYNKIETFEVLGVQKVKEFNIEEFEEKLKRMKEREEKVFTNAFLVSGYSSIKGEDKIEKTCTIVNELHKNIIKITDEILNGKSSKNTFETLKKIKGIGSFLAYQIGVDIGYINKEVFNEDEFVSAGPGCRNGIDYLFKDKEEMSYEECISYLCKIQEEEFNKLGININKLFIDRKMKKLNLMAMENCLCEISKYLRVIKGEGRPRNHYKGI